MNVTRSIAGLVLILTLVASAPQRTHAALPVIDFTNIIQTTTTAIATAGINTKDYVFDTLAYQVANLAIQSMTKSIVNWINSGFQGSPAFVTDLRTNLRGVGDAVANRFFAELSSQAIATTPFQDKVLDAVRLAYYLHTSPESFYTRYPYTLNRVSANDRAFLAGDFSQGGFNAWFATVMNPQNNPYGAHMLANEALENAVAGATGDRLEELSWNRGFLSWRGDCAVSDSSSVVALSGADPCLEYEIRTPGSVIMESLNKVQGVPFDRLVSADEFNEIIGALLNQLALKILGGGGGGGVRGLSQPSSGGGPSFFDQTDTTSTSNLAATFTSSLAQQKAHLESFRSSWERIRSAAQAAEQKCGSQSSISSTLGRATAALTKVAGALTALSEVERDIAAANAAGGNQSAAINAILQDYFVLSNSDAFPRAEEIAEAQAESQDTGDTQPGSLYSQMVRFSQPGGCSTNN